MSTGYTPMEKLFEFYNFKQNMLLRVPELTQATIGLLLKGKNVRLDLKAIQGACAYLNISSDMLLNISTTNAIKLVDYENNIYYMDFNEYVLLRARGVINDIFKEEEVIHEINKAYVPTFIKYGIRSEKIKRINEKEKIIELQDLLYKKPLNVYYKRDILYSIFIEEVMTLKSDEGKNLYTEEEIKSWIPEFIDFDRLVENIKEYLDSIKY